MLVADDGGAHGGRKTTTEQGWKRVAEGKRERESEREREGRGEIEI